MESNVSLNSEKFSTMVMLVRLIVSLAGKMHIPRPYFFLIFDASYLNLINTNVRSIHTMHITIQENCNKNESITDIIFIHLHSVFSMFALEICDSKVH